MDLTPHQILHLIASNGFHNLGVKMPWRCFLFEPTLTSSLRFLRKNPEARAQLEAFYVAYKQRPIQPPQG